MAAPLAALRASEPGPGNLVKIADTGNYASLSGGKLTVSGGSGAFGGCRYTVGSVAKTIGLIQVWRQYRLTASGGSMSFGLAHAGTADTAGSITGFSQSAGLSIRTVERGTNRPSLNLQALVSATDYDLAVLQRAVGNHYFYRLATTGTWTLLWVNNQDDLSSGLSSSLRNGEIDNANVAFTLESVEIAPASLSTWLPTPIASDSFDRGGTDLGLTDGGAHLDSVQGGDGLAWTAQAGTWAPATNRAACGTLAGGIGIATVDTGLADILLECVPTRSAGVAGLVLGYADASNYAIAYHDGTNVKLDKVVAGVTTNVASTAIAYSAGKRLVVRRVGSNVHVAYNDASTANGGHTISDAAILAATKHGVYTTDTGNGLDTFLAWRTTYGTGTYPRDTVAARVVTLSGPVPQQGRRVTVGTIPIAGTYAGGGTVSVEARFNGGSWATIATGVTGAFSGTLSGQSAGVGSVEVRAVGQTTGASVHHVRMGKVYLLAGQSNMSGRGTNNQVATHATLSAGMLGNDNAWHLLSDPVDSDTGIVDTVSSETLHGGGAAAGSYGPPLATAIMSRLSMPVTFVPAALGGSAISQWQPGTDHQDRTTLYGSAVYRALLAGGVDAVLWHQGEAEATIAFGLTGTGYYAPLLAALGDAFYADLGCPTVDARVHVWTGAPSTDATHAGYVNTDKAATYGTHHVVAGPNLSSPNWTNNLHGTTDAELLDAATRWDAALATAGL